MEPEPPRPTGRVDFIDVTGKLVPYRDGQPAMLNMAGMSAFDLYILLFSDEEDLRAFLARANIPFDAIKRITQQRDFFDSVPITQGRFTFHIAVDPWFTQQGRLRYTEVFRP